MIAPLTMHLLVGIFGSGTLGGGIGYFVDKHQERKHQLLMKAKIEGDEKSAKDLEKYQKKWKNKEGRFYTSFTFWFTLIFGLVTSFGIQFTHALINKFKEHFNNQKKSNINQ